MLNLTIISINTLANRNTNNILCVMNVAHISCQLHSKTPCRKLTNTAIATNKLWMMLPKPHNINCVAHSV